MNQAMICPRCHREYGANAPLCTTCGAALVPSEGLPLQNPDSSATVLSIPGIGQSEAPLLASLLQEAGFWHHVLDGFGETIVPVILVRSADLPDLKAFLAQFQVRGVHGTPGPIPW